MIFMKISQKAIEKVKRAIQKKCGTLPERDQIVCEKAAIRIGKALARELAICNRQKGSKKRACHVGRMTSTKAIARSK